MSRFIDTLLTRVPLPARASARPGEGGRANQEHSAADAAAPPIRKPLHTDWAYRPQPWCEALQPPGVAGFASGQALGREMKVFHDCAQPELSLRQVSNENATLAPYALRLEVFRFDGSFLSLVVDLPKGAGAGLERRHVVRLDTVVEADRPLEIFARLNVKNGPNIEQLVRELPRGGGETAVEFDLAYTKMNERRVERLWLDLIFEGAEMNLILLRDLTLTRRPRLEL